LTDFTGIRTHGQKLRGEQRIAIMDSSMKNSMRSAAFGRMNFNREKVGGDDQVPVPPQKYLPGRLPLPLRRIGCRKS